MSRRLYSTATRTGSQGSSCLEIAAEFLSRCQRRGPQVQKQFIDANQLQRLSQTLNRPEIHPGHSIAHSPPKLGTILPPGYHLAYFTPSAFEAELGRDGSDRTFNPSPPFTRRMWAGGKMVWSRDNALRIGDTVTETTTLLSAEPKKTRDGVDMIVVGVEKQFENEKGVALIDTRQVQILSPMVVWAPLTDSRNWLFRPELIESPSPSPRGEPKALPEGISPAFPNPSTSCTLPSSSSGTHIRDFLQTSVSLFRFSALTFNGHKIHYSKQWCREVEGHRDIVVHGPLNLVNMLDLWRDTKAGGEEAILRAIEYRAMSPVYAEEAYRAVLESSDTGVTSVKLWTEDGRLAMQGAITTQ